MNIAVATTAPLMRVSDLIVRFERNGRSVQAVNGVSFSLNRGEILTIIGESGSGKTVLLRAALGLLPSYAKVDGSIVIEGHEIGRLSKRQLQRVRGSVVSMIFQEPSTAFDPVFTIGRQITETIMRHEGTSHAAALKRAEELLDIVAIPSAARRLRNYPHELSGGTRQRAMIALALCCRPSVLLADEPTTALDATVQIQLLLLLKKLQTEFDMAVIFVTHDMGVAAEISDRVAVMYAGRFVEQGDVESVLLTPRHPYTEGLLGSNVNAGMRGRPLRTIPGNPPDLSEPLHGCSFAPRCSLAQELCLSAYPDAIEFHAGHSASCWRLSDA